MRHFLTHFIIPLKYFSLSDLTGFHPPARSNKLPNFEDVWHVTIQSVSDVNYGVINSCLMRMMWRIMQIEEDVIHRGRWLRYITFSEKKKKTWEKGVKYSLYSIFSAGHQSSFLPCPVGLKLIGTQYTSLWASFSFRVVARSHARFEQERRHECEGQENNFFPLSTGPPLVRVFSCGSLCLPHRRACS